MIISRKAVDALGFFFIEDFVSLGGDSSIQRIYESVGRVVDIKEIAVDLSIQAASKVIERNVDSDDNRKLINDTISKIG